MKKVLLATTILGMTSGFAAAEIAFSGEATAGFASVLGADVDTYTSFELSVAATGESDSGLAFGASTSFLAGTSYDFDGDDTALDDANADGDDVMGNPEVFVSGDFGKVAFKVDGFDDLANDDVDTNDVQYTHSISGFDIGVVTDIDEGTYSVSLGYTVSGVALSAAYDDSDESSIISAEGTIGALALGLTYEDDQAADEAVTTLELGYAADAFSVSLEVADDDSWTIGAGYEANGLTLAAETSDDDSWEVTGSYDLGGGLTAEAGVDDLENMYVGARMAF
jgi:outer membrane protein OmpU